AKGVRQQSMLRSDARRSQGRQAHEKDFLIAELGLKMLQMHRIFLRRRNGHRVGNENTIRLGQRDDAQDRLGPGAQTEQSRPPFGFYLCRLAAMAPSCAMTRM